MAKALRISKKCSENEMQGCKRVTGVSASTAVGITMFSDQVVTPGTGKALVSMTNIQQESMRGIHSPQELVLFKSSCPPPRPFQPFGLQYVWQRVSCKRGKLVKRYCSSRQLLGRSVEDAHKAWHTLMGQGSVHPVIKACALSFSIISTPETTAYLREHWWMLWQQMDHRSPDYVVACFMCQYALAWAMQSQDLKGALKKVKACYVDMKELNPDNFILAPYYTVTIGRWIYEVHAHNLSVGIITEILGYAEETLRLITTLEEDWARIDAFGAKLSALNLFMLVANYCYGHPLYFAKFYEPLRLRIDHLYLEISEEFSEIQKQSGIVVYDQAWFHSVSATYYLFARNTATTQEEKDRLYALAQCSIAQSAHLYDRNGRYWRSCEEAKRSDDPDIILEYTKRGQSAPCI